MAAPNPIQFPTNDPQVINWTPVPQAPPFVTTYVPPAQTAAELNTMLGVTDMNAQATVDRKELLEPDGTPITYDGTVAPSLQP